MAATTRAGTPSHPSDQFAFQTRTPSSLSPGSLPTTVSGALENPSLLRPHSGQRKSASNSPKTDKARLSPGRAGALTGAAAMAEMKRRKFAQQQQQNMGNGSRQTSPNPVVAAMHSLMGHGGMSRPTDAPAPNKLSEPLRRVAEKITVPDGNAQTGSDDQVSPASLASFGTVESSGTGGGMTATANDHQAANSGQQFVAEPAQMTDGEGYGNGSANLNVPEQDTGKQMSFSYPGPPPQADPNQEGGPSRGMSLPGYGQGSPKSPASNKRHKCPYCSTDFTRHHNLKSHLLTHSQEKPYVCQTCQARFRRLHDLKRHTKLHTGERPHTCDKCGRKFARGDALARHNKGPGGCAGRRSSFGGDDDGGEDMDVDYEEGDDRGDEQGRRVSEPSRKRQHLDNPDDPEREIYRQQSSTYPPAPTRAMRGTMGPPQVVHPGSNSANDGREMSGVQPAPPGGSSMNSNYYGTGQVFAEPGMMTQSPKPLSPGQVPDQHRLSVGDGSMARNRSTSLTTQFQQQHFGRGSSSGRTPPLPNAQLGSNGGAQPNINLPPLSSSGQQPGRAIQGGSMNSVHSQQPQQGMSLSNPGSLSSHGRSSGGSLREMQQDPNDIWAYVRSLESRFTQMQDEYELRISRLQADIINLKGQLGQVSTAGSYTSEMGRAGY